MKRLLTTKKFRLVLIAGFIGVIWFGTLRWIANTEGQTVVNQFNAELPTLGGKQLWTDHVFRDGFRVQRNSLTGHFRLLDADDRRKAWGNRQDVDATLQDLCPSPAAPSTKPIVVLLHGLMRTSGSMKSLEQRFRDAGYTQTIRFGYASTQQTMDDSAKALREVLESQHPEAEFCFVGHSMGNIVTRRFIDDVQSSGDPQRILPRCRAMVMLGPPNQGAMIAKRLGITGVFGWVAGKGAMQLGPQWDEIEPRLAVPPFPFAVVAGHVKPLVSNPLTEGPGDFVVSLEEAELEGSASIHEVPVLHSFLMNDTTTQDWTIEFIEKAIATSGETSP